MNAYIRATIVVLSLIAGTAIISVSEILGVTLCAVGGWNISALAMEAYEG